MNPARPLVTGATSFLGTELVASLLEQGSEVHVVVRPASNLGRLVEAGGRGLEVHVDDGTGADLASIVGAVRPDVVIHLAGTYRRTHEGDDVEALVQSNVLFGVQLLEAMTSCDVRRIVVAGSAFQHFESVGYRALNLYAATKQAFVDVLSYYQDAHAVEAVVLTLPDVYGSGDWRPKLMAAIAMAQRSGEPLRLPDEDLLVDLVHVDDVVTAFMRAAELLIEEPGSLRRTEYSVSSGLHQRLSEVVGTFEEVGGSQIALSWGALDLPERRVRTPWEGPSLPGWRARVPLREGVSRYLAGD